MCIFWGLCADVPRRTWAAFYVLGTDGRRSAALHAAFARSIDGASSSCATPATSGTRRVRTSQRNATNTNHTCVSCGAGALECYCISVLPSLIHEGRRRAASAGGTSGRREGGRGRGRPSARTRVARPRSDSLRARAASARDRSLTALSGGRSGRRRDASLDRVRAPLASARPTGRAPHWRCARTPPTSTHRYLLVLIRISTRTCTFVHVRVVH